MHRLRLRLRHAVLGAMLAVLVTGQASAPAASTRSISLNSHLVTRDIEPDTLTAGFLTDKHLGGRGTVDYRYDRSTGGKDRFRVYFANGWFDVKLSLIYAPTTVTGTGRIVGGSGRFRGASGTIRKVTGTFNGPEGELDARLVGTLRVRR